ncbi:MAG: glycyl-radical enzyme activating protein [Desulfobacterales bacterium]|nr:glycyl-radical enzyme activating protein [Desulfobacterales bacterium]MBF0396618.1 glycyl-radical enzyme activating protein [Desulfobacterales bacterium]
MSSQIATIFEIQRMSTEDGPGLRTTVFFKGCPLKCIWCHNPESISIHPEVQWIGSRCIRCKLCLDVCPSNALNHTKRGVVINRQQRCEGCGKCALNCPSNALEQIGKKWEINELIHEVLKDSAYFKNSDRGGITASGGESTLQIHFLIEFFKILKQNNIHTALDTCGVFNKEAMMLLLPYTDMILYDIKEIDPEKHITFTGYSNENILKNLIYISNYITYNKIPLKIWIRTPIIPNTTARADNIRRIGMFISSELNNSIVEKWELCSFNNLCKDKYLRLDQDWQFKNSDLLTVSDMEQFTDIAKKALAYPEIVSWSGQTKID